ncbi:MAG: phosphoribosylamine--glycine ligase [Pseudomonadales bacterium]|nr:phosphoribosylamine--glycine ligase [Pseudomonadales bacterium]
MNVLIVGSGGREHALAWKAAQSVDVSIVYVAPGNAGTALENKVENVALGVLDIEKLAQFAQKKDIELTIVGPEVPLVAGIVDHFQSAGLAIFGPTKGAAQLEGSKAFTKDFLARHHIPTAAYGNFTDTEKAIAYIKEQGAPIVVKADGLAAGKGVILAQTEEEAINAVQDMLSGNTFGEAGHRVVVEEFLVGEEASFICMVDGKTILPLATSQDHKARDNGDKGPNTGGMGAYSPAPVVTQAIHDKIMDEVIRPTVDGMEKEGHPYTGFLYAGVMIDKKGIPKVLEYNCRFGDPETQPIMLRLKSDIVALCNAAIHQKLDQTEAKWDSRPALGIVLAAEGYPENYNKGDEIPALSIGNDTSINNIPQDHSLYQGKIFHAGTKIKNGRVLTNGGRVLCATALGRSVSEAQKNAYQLVKNVAWENAYYRDDIGHRAISREEALEKKQ